MTAEEYDKRSREIENLIAEYKINNADCELQIAMNSKSIVALEIERERILKEYIPCGLCIFEEVKKKK